MLHTAKLNVYIHYCDIKFIWERMGKSACVNINISMGKNLLVALIYIFKISWSIDRGLTKPQDSGQKFRKNRYINGMANISYTGCKTGLYSLRHAAGIKACKVKVKTTNPEA